MKRRAWAGKAEAFLAFETEREEREFRRRMPPGREGRRGRLERELLRRYLAVYGPLKNK
ncbi:MAG: hypothetical protein LBB48_00425 [Treponema sp.]|nr:hypothetical protein [Treponema sp.]